MLTATYSIVSLELEQKKARWTLSSLQQYIFNSIRHLKSAGGVDFEQLLQRLSQFEKYCQQRRVATFLVPMLRKITREADPLLDELEQLTAAGMALMRSLQARFRQALSHSGLLVEELCQSLEACCLNFCQRLNREEELVRLAERVMPSEAWFGFAEQALSQHSRKMSVQQFTDDEAL